MSTRRGDFRSRHEPTHGGSVHTVVVNRAALTHEYMTHATITPTHAPGSHVAASSRPLMTGVAWGAVTGVFLDPHLSVCCTHIPHPAT